jgi:hypothetical protein
MRVEIELAADEAAGHGGKGAGGDDVVEPIA